MRKTAVLLTTILIAATQLLYPQESARDRIEQRRKREASKGVLLPDGNRGLADNQKDEKINDAIWSRIIYRHLDLTKPANSPLWYPTVPTEGRINLFSMLFRLLEADQINAYEYIDGIELFTDEQLINFKELLDRFDIFYEISNGSIIIHDSDIPSQEVKGYYIKEAYYFDRATSALRVEPIAICPIIERYDVIDALTRYPLFWVPYSEIAEYASYMPIIFSDINSAVRGTVDDLFRMQRYSGEIYKVANPANLTIAQYCNSPEEIKAEQQRIEQELADFAAKLNSDDTASIIKKGQQIKRGDKTSSSGSPAAQTGSSNRTMRNRRY